MEILGFGTNAMKQIKVCGSCGMIAPLAETVCVSCGNALPQEPLYEQYRRRHKTCGCCGVIVSEQMRFCPQCGNSLKASIKKERRTMKKLIAWLLAAMLLASMLAGCGKEGPSLQEDIRQQSQTAAPEKPEEAPEEAPAGELYDAGNVVVLVPTGWKAFPDVDVFAEEEGTMNPDVLNVSKGGQTEADLFTKPYVRINYFGPSIQMMEPDSDWYENVVDIEPFTAGEHEWIGFSCESLGTPLAILWCEEGAVQYQATLTLGTGSDAISPEDADVRAILASVTPSDPGAASVEAEPEIEAPAPVQTDSFWDGQWYGWWCIQDGTGAYEKFNSIAWDAYAEIEDYADGTGYITLWDTETTKDAPLVRGYVNFDEDNVLTTEYCTFYDSGSWLPDVVDVVPMDFYDWSVDPANSSVSQFDHMVEISGYYADPENAENTMFYYIYLRPWGMHWEDVRGGDTSGCLYSDMMPVLYDDWYLPLWHMGVETLPASIGDGFALIEGGASEEAEPFDGEPGEMALEELKEALAWVKSNQSYDNTYEQIVEGIGVPGLYVDEFENNGKVFCRYRWIADEENRITITFEKHEDGTLTWNVTAWDGLD